MFEPFTVKAPAKINLALHVLGRRGDGYHEIDSIVAFADVGDELVFSPATEFAITATGPFAALLPPPEDNIIARAYGKVAETAASRGITLAPAAVHLTKNLPVAAGIGGGSADAAAALRGFLKIAGIEHPDDEIMAAALSLGADVPVCLIGKACRMQGVGERVTPIENFKPLHAVLVNPGVEVSTADVFRCLGLGHGETHSPPAADVSGTTGWRNDLQAPAGAIAPAVREVIEILLRHPGISTAGMSGSGATCFALLRGAAAANTAARTIQSLHPGWWVRHAALS